MLSIKLLAVERKKRQRHPSHLRQNHLFMNCELSAIAYEKKWRLAAIGYVAFCLFYTLTGNLHWRTPVMLAPSDIDAKIPFAAWTIWLYHSQFFFLALNIHWIKKVENLRHVFYSMALASLLSFLIFTVYPTTLPRSFATDSGLTAKAFAFLYALDSAANCFPSLHVSLAWLAAIGVLRESKTIGALMMLWALAITLSTLTTKQHYFVDVIGGLLLAILCSIFVAKFSGAAQ
jgi:membrane-associated phospholipid phosphatase